MASGAQLIRVEVRAVVPTSGGSAVFLTNGDKTMVIHIDHTVGMAITMAMRRETRERPQTHELLNSILAGLGAKVDRVVISGYDSGVYFARLFITAENELYERKILEIDARPSDSVALAVAHEAPVYVAAEVWNGAEDVSNLLKSMEESGNGEFSRGGTPGDE